MAWSDDNLTCQTVYSVLTDLDQVDKNVKFPDVGALTMPELEFFNATASGDAQKAEATMVATSMDSDFINTNGGTYAGSVAQAAAIAAMVAVMVDESKTVEELSDVVATKYIFN